MHAFPNVEEVDRYISERLLIAGSQEPNVFTPDAVDFIFRCSEGIPRNINNLCDNAMLAAYSAGEQTDRPQRSSRRSRRISICCRDTR